MLYLSGVARTGTGAHQFRYGLDTQSFLNQTQAFFDNDGLRLTYLDTYGTGADRRWMGIYRSGDWAHRLQIGQDTATFAAETQRLFDEQGLRLETVVPYVEGGQLWWAGSYRSGDWAHRFFFGDDTDAFAARTQQLFDHAGMRLTQAAPYVAPDGRLLWAGIYVGGDWAHRFFFGRDTGSFIRETQQLFDSEGFRLDHLVSYAREFGDPRWAGIYTPASDAHRFFVEMYTQDFTSEVQRLFDTDGLHLTCVEGHVARADGVRLHLKVLDASTIPIDDMVRNMREVYRSVGIAVEVASTENLNLPLLTDLDVGSCDGGVVTTEQTTLFGNRNNAGANDVVVYICRSVGNASSATAFNGCANFPAGSPGAAVASYASGWTLAHEVGHVLGLNHVDDPAPPDPAAPAAQLDRLMTGRGTNNITNPPPDLDQSERSTMLASALTVDL
jgi:Metallo-peptidase family M12B Reprolysin-like